LKSIEEAYKGSDEWERVYKKVANKAIIYTILDQDATYRKYISKNWKDIKFTTTPINFGALPILGKEPFLNRGILF